MITLYFGQSTYEYPNSWDELTKEQYLALIPLLNRVWSGEISILEMRVSWFRQISGLVNLKVPRRCKDRFLDNVVTASRQFNFFYKLDYGSALDDISFSSRQLLVKTPADEINSEDSEIRYARTVDYTYIIDAVWAKNLIDEIILENSVLSGWTADVNNGILSTSLTALQFTQGCDLLSLITSTSSFRPLAVLVALLYGADINDDKILKEIEMLPIIVISGVLLNFQAFVSYIFGCTHYAILWDTKTNSVKAKEVITSSFSDSLYHLCKDGYGNYEQIERMPLLTYLNIMRSDMIGSIKSMSASGSSADEIAEHTHLPITLILKML